MNDSGANGNGKRLYFHADDDGNPDFSRPMTQVELLQQYWENADDDPYSLADLYLNFNDFGRIEFHIFRDRLSAAILVASSARDAVSRLKARLERQQKDGSHRVSGWEGEADFFLESSLGVVQNASEISIGATMLTAFAALESLLKDLSPVSAPTRSRIHQLLKAFLKRQNASPAESQRITEMVSKVSERRNVFAHTLTGSYFVRDNSTCDVTFDPQSMHDTMFTVAEIAIALEALVD